MAFFHPFLNDPFFSTPSASLFSPSSSLLFDDDPFFSNAPLYVYDAPTSRRRAGRMNAGNDRQQQQLKEQQASSQDNAQIMVSGGDNAAAPAASTTSSSSSPANKQTAVANNTNTSNNNVNNRSNSAVSSLRQPRLLSPLSMLSAFNPNTSLLSSRAVLPSMSVDLLSTDKEYTVHASVPGVAKQDLRVTVEDGVLTIEAERREETKHSRTASPKNNNNSQQVPSTTPSSTTSSGQPQDEKQREEKVEQGQAATETGSHNTTTTTSNNNSSSAQPMETEQDNEPQYHHVESFYGHISRSITLPDDCNTDAMAAKYEDGVLKISIPRLQEKRQRGTRLEIQ